MFELRSFWLQRAEQSTKNDDLFLYHNKITQEAGQVQDESRSSAPSLRIRAFTSFHSVSLSTLASSFKPSYSQ